MKTRINNPYYIILWEWRVEIDWRLRIKIDYYYYYFFFAIFIIDNVEENKNEQASSFFFSLP